MDKIKSRLLMLAVNAEKSNLPVLTRFVESTTKVSGMLRDECLSLSLATEEIFLYLCKFVCPDKPLEVHCHNGIYYVRISFSFSAKKLNLSGLNIVGAGIRDPEEDIGAIGLLIASRSVDHLDVKVEENNRILLSVTKEKSYPAYEEKHPVPGQAENLVTETPDTAKLKVFAAMTSQYYKSPYIPSFFSYPGKLVDMVQSGEYIAFVSLNEKREVAGGIVLNFWSEKILQMYGPYCFVKAREREIGEALLNACLVRLARTKAIGLFSIWGLPEALQNHFENLGTLSFYLDGKLRTDVAPFYRLLHEDPGLEVWCASSLRDYLERQYRQLALARMIKTSLHMGETISGASLFSTEMHRNQSVVILRPLLAGNDYEENIERHLRFLLDDHFVNIYVELDVGIPWHAGLTDPLLANGLQPVFIMPFAGKADLVIFKYYDKTKS
ncbi:MAG TPA: hypothetical protein PKN70_12590 [Smithellaceae bacterium]|nr:hypothetical protein [Smithellaceae bacterium]HQM45018.1 hypothetical protein [Smithellaceae bacterium]